MTTIERALINYSAFWTVLLAIVVAILTSLLISSIALHSVQVLLIFLIGLGGLIIFYYLRKDLILAIYYWVILLWPYFGFTIAHRPVKASYLVIPVLCFVILTSIFVRNIIARNIRPKVYSHPIFTLSLLYTMIILMSSFLNLRYVTPATYSFLALWLLGFAFFTLYLGYISTFDDKNVISLAENTLNVLVWIGLIAVIVAVLEYWWPVEIHEFYNPRVGEGSWGNRGGIEWFINLKRSGSIIGAPNAFGMFLMVTSIIAWYKWKFGKNPLLLGIIPIYFAGIFLFSNARQAIVGFGLIFILIFLHERKYIHALLFGVVCASVFMMAKPFMSALMTAGKHYIDNPYDIGPDIPILGERISIWAAVLYTLIVSPVHLLSGYGVSNDVMLSGITKQTAHNIFLTAFHFSGIPGLVLLTMIIISLLRRTKRLLAYSIAKPFLRPFYFIIIAMLLSSLVDSIFFFNPLITWVMFPLIACLIKVDSLAKQETKCKG